MFRLIFIMALILALLGGSAAWAERIWWDGTREEANAPPGKLLSDNTGYWGECVLTGVEYHYETPPTNPADVWRDQPDRFGRRLLDGIPSGNWWVPVGQNPGQPLVVIFDFQRPCTFAEVDLSTRSQKVAVKIECRDGDEDGWRVVLERRRDECPDRLFHRWPLPQPATGRFLRLSVQAEGITWVEEVLVWGDAAVTPQTPEAFQPVTPTQVVTGTAFSSLPGIEKTSFSDAQYWDWQRALGQAAQLPAVWSRVPTWDRITDRPLLPAAEAVNAPVPFVLARNETECAALALTNTSMEKPVTLEVRLGSFRRQGRVRPAAGLRGEIRVGGTIGSRYYGVNIGPLFAADNLLGRSLMQRYLTNGAEICDFPRLTLPPAGSAVLWLSVTTEGAQPGRYEAELKCDGGPSMPIRVEVLDVTLPQPFVWLNTWSGGTSMFPFVYGDRPEREVRYKQSLGVTVWNGWPTPGSEGERARKQGRALFHIWGLGDYGHRLYAGQIDPEKLTEEDEQKIAEMIHGHVRQAEELGLSYDDWYVELADEPGQGNSLAFGALARLIRQADPNVRIYCNPCFWVGNGVLPDAEVYSVLSPWYRENVDVSVPLYLLLRDHPKCFELFDAPRFVRASYTVSTQSAKGEGPEQVQLYRRLAWDAFARGWNGWGFYSYYAPRGNPWNDFDADWYTAEDLPDYQMVYPGPRGPTPTRQSEAVREGWEDYCLLTLFQEQASPEELQKVLDAYTQGQPLEQLRAEMLRILGQ